MNGWLYKLRAGAFGLIVVEHADPFTIPHLPLPLPPRRIVSVQFQTWLNPKAYDQLMVGGPRMVDSTASISPADSRRRKEAEARSSEQPFEWASRVYVTVGGEVRWRCCGNLFDDDHSPYCQAPDNAMGGTW